jgi:DNA recombination protein RmuC
VDAKVPLDAYLQALDAPEAERADKLASHAKAVREHIKALGSRSYFTRLPRSPDFVVLFLPSEAFLAAALEIDPTIIEIGVEKNVMLATPTTLVALLRAVAQGWREEQVAQNTREIMQLGRELHERIGTLTDHFGDLRRSLQKAVEAYDKATGTLSARVIVTAKKLKELGAGSERTPEVVPIETDLRLVSAVPADEAAAGRTGESH